MDSGRKAHQVEQARVGRTEQRRDLRHHAGQFTRTEGQPKIGLQLMADLAIAETQRDFLVDHEQQHVQPQPVARQRGGDGILMVAAAAWAPAPFNQVLGDDGRSHQIDIFEQARAGRAPSSKGGAAVRASASNFRA